MHYVTNSNNHYALCKMSLKLVVCFPFGFIDTCRATQHECCGPGDRPVQTGWFYFCLLHFSYPAVLEQNKTNPKVHVSKNSPQNFDCKVLCVFNVL